MLLPVTSTDPTGGAVRFDSTKIDRAGSNHTTFQADSETKWGWACRALDARQSYSLLTNDSSPPRVGDVALVQVEAVNHHTRVFTSSHKRLRLYEGDKLVGIFGNRYATDAFEGQVQTAETLHMLTSAAMMGTVISRHRSVQSPTRLRLLGYLGTSHDRRINLRSNSLRTVISPGTPANVVLAVGTGMNSGKTTTGAKLVKALMRQNMRVAACKLTGSVCHRDLFELKSTGAHDVRDFSDYGFPSTYLCEREPLVNLFATMLADCQASGPDVVVMEIADGVLQRETTMILEDPLVRRHVRGVVLAAPCSSSALYGLEQIRRHRHETIAVSGIISNSPLFLREFSALSNTPVACSAGAADELARLVIQHCQIAPS